MVNDMSNNFGGDFGRRFWVIWEDIIRENMEQVSGIVSGMIFGEILESYLYELGQWKQNGNIINKNVFGISLVNFGI